MYLLLGAVCLVGYTWVFYNINGGGEQDSSGFNTCLIKRFTDFPCPSCGSTRSVLAIFKGDLYGALTWNPLGFILGVLMIVAPVWLVFDLLTKKETLLKFYRKMETALCKKWVAVPAVFLILINWIWNIYKDL